MKVTVGTDIIEVSRIEEALESDKFKTMVFTDKEIQYCESKKKMRYEHYAARFAGKEATFKAISKYLDDKYSVSWKNIEILNDKQGRPYVNLIGVDLKKADIDISLSHLKEYAVANVSVCV